MNDFLSWCMHHLVPLLSHDVPLVLLIFILGQSPIKNAMFCAGSPFVNTTNSLRHFSFFTQYSTHGDETQYTCLLHHPRDT